MALQFEKAVIDCTSMVIDSFLLVGSRFSLEFLTPIAANASVEKFFPFHQQQSAIYVRQEMVDVFKELIKPDRNQRQVLIGSPGVGKSILLFIVALHRALVEGKHVVYIRKTRRRGELTSLFFITKQDTETANLTVHYSRSLSTDWTVNQLQDAVLEQFADIHPSERPAKIVMDEVLIFLDGLHEGDNEINDPHHYLATSGGHDSLEGESGMDEDLVVLGGWQKEAMGQALESTTTILTRKVIGISLPQGGGADAAGTEAGISTTGEMKQAEMNDDELDAIYKQETLEDIFFHTGGRIREAFSYSRDRDSWKRKKRSMVDKISKEQATLCLIETKGSGDPKSMDRIRTMFRNDDTYFGSALQIVDSQYYVRLLQDRVGLDQYFNAYMHAKNRGLACAAGCHFEELLHRVFEKRPHPILGVLQSTGSGTNCISELSDFSLYWIPSIPNFANIDAAFLVEMPNNAISICCMQYTVAKKHSFHSRTFLVKFLRPLLKNLGLAIENVSVCIYFIVPDNVFGLFQIPEDVEEAGYAAETVFVDCSSVQTISNVFGSLKFITQPVKYHEDKPHAKKRAI